MDMDILIQSSWIIIKSKENGYYICLWKSRTSVNVIIWYEILYIEVLVFFQRSIYIIYKWRLKCLSPATLVVYLAGG